VCVCGGERASERDVTLYQNLRVIAYPHGFKSLLECTTLKEEGLI
jgi:hypothetical protein